MFQGGVGGEDGVVWFNNRGGNLWCWVDTEFQLALLAIVDRQALHQKSSKTGTSSTTEGVENKETLESRAVVSHATDLVQNLVDELLSDSVVATGVVVRGILLASDHHLGVEKRAVCASADLVDDVGLEIAVDGARNVLALACISLEHVHLKSRTLYRTRLGEESAEAMVIILGFALLGEVTVRLKYC